MKHLCILLIAVLLVACGGGDYEEEPNKTTEPVNCQVRPELCR